MQDHTLVESLQTRRAAALAAAYDTYARPLYGYCCLLLHDETSAEAALRDTFFAAELRIDELGDAARLKPWLFALARGEATRRRTADGPIRARGRTAGPPYRRAAAGGPGANDSDARPWGRRAARDDAGTSASASRPHIMAPRTMAETAVAALAPAEREALELAERYGLSEADIAAVLELPARRARVLVARARHRLRQALSAVILARTGREHCRRLSALTVAGARLDPHRVRRIGRHAGMCRTCGRRGSHRASAAKVLTMLPPAEPPAGLRWQILSSYSDPALIGYRLHVARRVGVLNPAGFPLADGRRRRSARLRGAAAATTFLLVVAAAVLAVPPPPSEEPPDDPPALLPGDRAGLTWPYLQPPYGDARGGGQSAPPDGGEPTVQPPARGAGGDPGPALARPALTAPIATAAEVARTRGGRSGTFTATATEGRHPQRPERSPTGSPSRSSSASPSGPPSSPPPSPPSGASPGSPTWAPSDASPGNTATGSPAGTPPT